MKTNIQSSLVKAFEKSVFERLFIESSVFNSCVESHRGYAYMLRSWIKEAYLKGNTIEEVAKMIKNSALPLDQLAEGKPLHLTKIITQLPRNSVLTVFS